MTGRAYLEPRRIQEGQQQEKILLLLVSCINRADRRDCLSPTLIPASMDYQRLVDIGETPSFQTSVAVGVAVIAFQYIWQSSSKRDEKTTKTTSKDSKTPRYGPSLPANYEIHPEAKEYPADGTWMETLGHIALFVFSHFICYYLWWAAEFNSGCIGNPFPIKPEVYRAAAPTATSVTIYTTFCAAQLLFSATLPGVTVMGLKIPSWNGQRLPYHCNGLASWYLTIAIMFALHYTGIFDFASIYTQSGALLSTGVLAADLVAIIMYIECLRTKRASLPPKSGSVAHDFVMGQYLNPRIRFGDVDLKLWAEIRVSWMFLYALDVSAAMTLQRQLGYIPYRMWIVLLIHGLYTNACQKGEESIPFTWDIFHERWGWMLIYWNMVGVAFAYTFNGRFIAEQGADLQDFSFPVFVCMALAVIASYWVFDEANAQKNRFRAKDLPGGYQVRKFSFPQLPNATLKEPVKHLLTAKGSKLLTDGWYAYCRKPHYTSDLCLALLLSLTGGFGHVLPYFFVAFFFPMLVQRSYRDNQRCAAKYGKDWDRYCKEVPYILVPGVY